MENRVLKDLQPEKVFGYFEEICAIPHGSHNIQKISDYLAAWAKAKNFSCTQEKCGNIIIRVPASAGYEASPVLILQGHMDMVAVKEADLAMDMEREGLRLRVEGDYVFAEGTSLGGDDGIALAYGLAIADSDAPHPPLELLFTVNEETGMDGARELDVSHLTGRSMVNLDAEEEGVLLVGCAGGASIELTAKPQSAPAKGAGYRVFLSGLQGGHSGAEIHKNRENAIAVLARLLDGLSKTVSYTLCGFFGGSKDNVIPSEAEAWIFCEEDPAEALSGQFQEIFAELSSKEPKICFALAPASWKSEDVPAISADDAKRLLGLLQVLPFGVVRMSADMQGVVETSANIGTVCIKEQISITCSVRSMAASAKDQLCRQIEILAKAFGYDVRIHSAYPGWTYRKDSPLRDAMLRIYEECCGAPPVVCAIHAGLECGLFLEKMPELDCISMGPDIFDIHSTRERLSISSTQRVFACLQKLLAEWK